MVWDLGVGRSCCLNQDLQDFDGFSGWVFARNVRCGWDEEGQNGSRLRGCPSSCLNQDLRDFDGFSGWVFARDEIVEGMEGLTG